jgi:hypothetical protein
MDIFSGGLALGYAADTARANLAKIVTGSATWDPGTVADNGDVFTYLTVTGSIAGAYAIAGLSAGLEQGLVISAYAATNVVYVTVVNKKGSDWAPGSLTLSALVIVPAS